MDDELPGKIDELVLLQSSFLGSSMRRSEVFRRTQNLTDLFAFGALKRALFLLDGFVRMIKERNLVCAGALLPLQLDTALRFHALFLVDDPEDFSAKVVGGMQVKQLCDRHGRHLTDRFLCETAGREFSWVPSVYDATSGYIHFSERHLLSGQSVADSKKAIVSVDVTSYDDEVPDRLYLEAVDAFKKAADLLDCYINRWTDGR